MKLSSLALLLFNIRAATVVADCDPAVTEIDIASDISKLTVDDYDVETVNRFSSNFRGNKIVLKGYDSKPVVTLGNDGTITISEGELCGEPSSAFSIAASISPLVMANSGLISPLAGFATAMLMGLPFTSAAGDHSITIDIYTDTDALIHDEVGSMTCPPESLYFEHHPSVHGGYKGCVGEKYLLPCGQDAQGASDSSLYSKYPINWNGSECVETGYTFESRTFWILWGDPLDKHELLTRTGLLPTVYLPLERGPYPAYTYGTDETTELYDDSSSAKAKAKDFLVYIGAITEAEKADWYVTLNEGAEQGISYLWAAMALDIAQTTCNRDIYVLMEAPAYGYDNGEIALWVNKEAKSFYSGEECACYPNCNEPTVTVNNRGFFPPNIPSETGGDGIVYPANSDSPNSPWFESMVFPENPSGVIKTPQLPNSSRRVCDGVYVWPMYFYFNNFEIPLEDRPDCAGWAYATTKGFSASVRTGWITYKKSMTSFVAAVSDIASEHGSLSYGSYSEWSWMGQMQLQDMMMSKPLTDPTSWIGAYSTIMKEKWDVITDAFADCPVLELTNSGKGAYAFFLYKAPYLGLQTSFISSFFLDVLGVSATTYNWGFRGADPSEFYGEGVGTHDFTRMQLYRDVNVYLEVARRAKIVCADTTASIGDFISIDDWKAKSEAAIATGDGRRALRETMSHLTERQLKILENNEKIYSDYNEKAEACAGKGYTTSCFYKEVGKRHSDYVYDYDHKEEFVAKPVDKKGLRGF
mmetsp:Transcript_26693/g.40072  ORF Transcript_26693/g.40072 Transcript_26693/m.40072 type:complete len:755 (-) Transcript_26693:312-2576(-)